MKVINQKTIFSGADNPALTSCTFPAICQLKNGTIFASFKGSISKGPLNIGDNAMTCISKDGGENME